MVIDNNAESGLDSDNNNGETQTGEDLSPATRRPVRQAARQKLKGWLNSTENFAVLGVSRYQPQGSRVMILIKCSVE